jgi:hypothetical protein
MFQQLGNVSPEFIYKAIEFVINSHCGEVETLMCFLVLANKLRALNRMIFLDQLPITLFNLFINWRNFPSLQVVKGYRL